MLFVSTAALLAITVQTKETKNSLSKTQDSAPISESTTIEIDTKNSSEESDSIDSKTIYFYNNFEFHEENVTDDSVTSLIYPRKLKIVKNVSKDNKRHMSAMRNAVRTAAREGLEAMKELYEVKEPDLIKKGFSVKLKSNL